MTHALNIGTQIAAAMGASWEAFGNSTVSGIIDDDARFCFLAKGRDTDGMLLQLYAHHGDKLSVSVAPLRYLDADGKAQTLFPSDFTKYENFKKTVVPRTSLTATRNPAHLASAIVRNVVRPSRDIWQAMLDRRNGALQHARDVEAARQVLLGSGVLVQERAYHDNVLSLLQRDHGYYGKFNINGANSVNVELSSVPLALATQIAALIKENRS